MRSASLWARLLGLSKVVVEGVEFDEDEQAVVVSVRPRKATKRRCGQCGKRCPGYDQGEGRRRWRALDLGTIKAFLEADSPRVRCAEHGVVAAQVPWARHGAGHTYAFDDTAAWLVTHCSKSAVRDLLRIAWRTVGSIVCRVVADAEANTDRFANLRPVPHLTADLVGFDPRPGPIALSQGGLYAISWASEHSDCLCGIYLDNAICDPRSWPGGLGRADSAPAHWRQMLDVYGLGPDDLDAVVPASPISKLAPLAAARIPLLVAYGDADRAVPSEENSEILLSRYAELGGPALTIVRAGADHHLHGIDDTHGGPAVIQEFFEEAHSGLPG